MATIFNSVATVLAAVGQDLGVTDYITIDQKRIDTFADATGDHQWIHVDPVKAKDGPFGATVAHGYLTLSLANLFLPQLVNYENLSMGVNYGTDKVRFPAPVKVNSRVRGKGDLVHRHVGQIVERRGGFEEADRPGKELAGFLDQGGVVVFCHIEKIPPFRGGFPCPYLVAVAVFSTGWRLYSHHCCAIDRQLLVIQ